MSIGGQGASRESRHLSRDQFFIRSGAYEACIASVGATIRSVRWRSIDLIAPFAADAVRPAMHGAILAPWPNRTDGGRYAFGDTEHQLPINEQDRNNDAHGLVAWLDVSLVGAGEEGERGCVTLDLQLQGKRRAPNKSKFPAGSEMSMWAVISDVPAERSAAEMRAAWSNS